MDNIFNSLIGLLPADGWQRLLVDALWMSTFVGLLGFVIVRWFVNQAAARAWVLLIALTACALLPATSFFVRSSGWELPILGGNTELAILDPTLSGVPDRGEFRGGNRDQEIFAMPDELVRSAERPKRSTSDAPILKPKQTEPNATFYFRVVHNRLILIVFGIVWLGSSLFLLLKLAISAMTVQRMVNRARPCLDTKLLDAVSDASKRIGLRATPRVLMSNQISAPMVLAFFRPALLIPDATMNGHDEQHWATITAHELAHIRRRDGWSRLWVQWVAVLLPLQPLVWWMRHSFFEACEETCDDWAVAIGIDPIDLASVITSWSGGSRDRTELLLAVGMSGTRSRVLRLLAMSDRPTATLSVRWQFCASFVAILICGGLAFAQPPRRIDQTADQTQAERQPDSDATQQQPNSPSPEKIDATVKAITISGTCVDENNTPLPKIHVRLFHYSFDSSEPHKLVQTELPSTHCDINGRFTFKDIVGSSKFDSWHVIAQHPGKATANIQIPQYTFEDQTIKLELHPGGTLQGRVVNEEGNPVAGAFVVASCPLMNPLSGICSAVSDAEGNYEISDLWTFDSDDQKPQPQPHPVGDGTLIYIGHPIGQVQHPDYARDQFSYSKIPSEVDVTVRWPAVIEGRIFLKDTGEPAIGAHVEIYNDSVSSDDWTRTMTDSEGQYRIESLPPGSFRVSVSLAGQPNLFVPEVALTAGNNHQEFQMERGGVVKGRVVDVTTEQPIRLNEGENMDISESDKEGRNFGGMPSALIQRDGSFTLLMPAGHRYLGMYFGPNWRGVNTDQLFEDGIEVIEGQTIELEIRVQPLEENWSSTPIPLSEEATKNLAEQAAIAAIKQLGGWVELEAIDGKDHVVEINMFYHEDERMGRDNNRLICDECFSYVQKFPMLKRLLLNREQATDAGLANLRGLDRLEEIYMWDASVVSDAGTEHLANLKNLRAIHLDNSKITDESLRHFSKLPKIEKLSLQGNRFTNKGLAYLQDATKLKELSLGLGANDVTDDGLSYLSKLSNLERLDLQGSNITDAGLRHLRSLKKLKDLWLGGTQVTEAGIAELRRDLPKLESPRGDSN